MGLLIALGALGVGFGLWSKVLTITGTVNTGEVNAELSIEEVDQGDIFQLSDDGVDENKQIENKLIANCVATLEDGLPNEGPQTLRVTITDGYPSFWCIVNFNIHNNGSIPIKLEQPSWTADPGLFVNFGFSRGVGGDLCYFDEDINGTGIFGTINPHPQLEFSEVTYCTLWLHVEQSAAQGAALKFEGTILAHQWNEEP
jgi:hypothetical protein